MAVVALLAVAGCACSSAMAGSDGPKTVKASQHPLPHPELYTNPPLLTIPISVAPAILVNGHTQLTGPWMPYIGGGVDTPTQPVYDCFEPDSTGFPTGFCTCGANQAGNCPAAPAGSRWYYGGANVNPFSTNDMTIPVAFANAHCAGI